MACTGRMWHTGCTMFFRLLFGDRNYEKSNDAITVRFRVTAHARALARLIVASIEAEQRNEQGELLLDHLCDLAKIDICNLTVSDTKQYHRRRAGKMVMKQYGYYKPNMRYIYIQNRTAVRGQILAGKTFFNTLLHEWMHHYDHCALGLRSIHSAGFYKRLNNIQTELLDPL